MKSKTILKQKKYTMLDYVIIPFKATPVAMSVIALNRIIVAFVPAITVIVTAIFVDNAIAIYNGIMEMKEIIFPIICYILIHIYTNINLAFIYNFMNVRYDMGIYHYVTADLVNKRGRLEYKHIEDDKTWNLISRTCDEALFYIAQGMNNVFNIMEVIVKVGSIVIILMTQVWWVGLVVLAIMLPMIPVAKNSGKQIYDARKKVRSHIRRYQYLGSILNGRDNVEERTVFGYTDSVNDKWLEQYNEAYRVQIKAEIDRNVKMKVAGLITLVVSVLIVGVLLVPTLNGNMSAGMFIALATATFDLVSMMANRVAVCTRKYAMQKAFLEDLTAFMALSEREGSLDLPAKSCELLFDSIVFEDVSFKYPETDRYILKNFNLTIEKNKHYAIVGVNGAGKTTLTKLLTGMYDNYTGNIYINDKNLREYRLRELKALFSVVYQDFAKYQITVGENIRLGNILDIDDVSEENCERIQNIIESVDLKDAIDNLSSGLNTNLGKISEDAVDLSGGQWQRLAMARLLYHPAFVRILDEPTAALDPIAESNLYKTFGKINKGKTTIFITHRLGAARLADEIVVLSDGQVYEMGSHEELIKNNGIYAKMFESQKSWYIEKSEERGQT